MPQDSAASGQNSPWRLEHARAPDQTALLPSSGEASPLPQVVADGGLVEPLPFVQELGDVLTSVLQQVVLY